MNKIIPICLTLFIAGCSCHVRDTSEMRPMMRPENIPAEASGPLQSIHFAFDSAALTDESKSIIKSNLAWLKRNGSPMVELGGNCDERGTNEYNMVLGMNRSKSNLNYIASLGENTREFTTASYGEELPLDPAHNESAWAKNRRVDFNVK